MWLFLSRRIRTWLLFGLAVPLLGRLLHSLAVRARTANPSGSATRVLSRADTTVQKFTRRRSGGRNAHAA